MSFQRKFKTKDCRQRFEAHREVSSSHIGGPLNLTTSDHKRLVRGTAMERAARDQLMRNAAVAMGNSECQDFVAPLSRALNDNRYPVVREHCAWALGKLGGSEATFALKAFLNDSHETDETVLKAARSALDRANLP